MTRRFVMAMAVLAAIAASVPAHAETCRVIQLASFDISDNEVFVPVKLNGAEHKFLVDTGGRLSTVSPAVAEALHLEPRHLRRTLQQAAVDGTVFDQSVLVDEMQIGIGTAKQVELALQPQKSRPGVGIEDVEGSLAPDYLVNFDLDFDFGGHKFNLVSPEHCKDAVVYWSDTYAEIKFYKNGDGHIVVPVTLDGFQTTAMIDTGSTDSFISAGIAAKAFHLPLVELSADDPDKPVMEYAIRFKTLELGGITVQNPLIGLMPDEEYRVPGRLHQYYLPDSGDLDFTPLIIGLDVLRKLHIYIAYDEKKLYVTGANATRTPPQPPATPPTATPPSATLPAAAQSAATPPATPATAH